MPSKPMATAARYNAMKICVVTGKDGRLLSPIQQARVFAQHSRSSKSVHEILEELDAEKDEAFHEKWIVGFGHNAIAELATLPVDFAGVSMLAAKAIEAWQRPGVCEKSTRMQDFSNRTFFDPFEGENCSHPVVPALRVLKAEAFSVYTKAMTVLPEYFRDTYPKASAAEVKKRTFDSARYCLPAGTTTSLGICAYPRDVAEMIQQLGASGLREFRNIAGGLKEATSTMGGPLIRHTEPDAWFGEVVPDYPYGRARGTCAQPVELMRANGMTDSELHDVYTEHTHSDFEDYMARRPPKAPVPKQVFRNSRITFRICLDYGAFRDLQRHRRMEQFVEYLTPHYGYSTPELSPDFAKEYYDLMDGYESFPWPERPAMVQACQYFLPMAFRISFIADMDLEQVYYLTELRTQPAGHISYRQIAYDMYKQALEEFPWAMQWCRAVKP